jgi:hypothetical protein
VKQFNEEMIETGKKTLPGIIKTIWKEQVIPVWEGMNDWFQINIWQNVFKKEIEPRVKEEIEKRKPIVKEEFKKEKEELKEELPGLKKSLWERFLDLWRYGN